jgi:hypothetical protein
MYLNVIAIKQPIFKRVQIVYIVYIVYIVTTGLPKLK